MVDILCTNDDGYRSAGLVPLVRRLAHMHSVAVVAPDGPRSWVSKSITAREPLTLRRDDLDDVPVWALSGSPADCVQVGLYEVLAEPPKLVVSGINFGANAGFARILNSGTIGAAVEGAIDGVPAMAVSMHISTPLGSPRDDYDPALYPLFEAGAAITARLVDAILAGSWDPQTHVLNVNFSDAAAADAPIEVTAPFTERYGRLFTRDGDTLRHLTPPLPHEAPPGTDLHAVLAGRVSVTPLDFGLNPTAAAQENLRRTLGAT